MSDDTQRTVDFLNLIYGIAPMGDYYLQFSNIDPRGVDAVTSVSVRVAGVSPFITRILNWQQESGHGLYFRVGMLDRRIEGRERGGKKDTRIITALWTEVDERPPQAATFWRLSMLSAPPSIIISSGGGWHLYWLLQEPQLLLAQRDIADVERVLRGMAMAARGDSKVAEVARMMRLPYSWNTKYFADPERKPKKCVIADCIPGRYDYATLRALFAPLGEPAPLKIERTVPLTTPANDGIPQGIMDMIEGGSGKGERDSMGFWIANRLQELGVSQTEAESLLTVYASRCNPPLDAEFARRKVASAYSTAPRVPLTSRLRKWMAAKDRKTGAL